MTNDKNFIYPNFDNSLVNVPHSILAHFNLSHDKPALSTPLLDQIKECSKVVLFLVDGFGYNLFKKEATKFPFFKKIDEGEFSEKITTIFPSTTAAGITTFESGLTPREHGLFKWNLYLREVDAVVQPLPYKVVQTEYSKNPVSLPKDSKMLFNGKTIYESLAQGNVQSFYFIPKVLKDAVYTKAMSKGATIIQYVSIIDLLISLRKILQETEGKAFCYVYWGNIDTQEHVYGPWTEQARGEIKLFDEMMQKEFIDKLDEKTLNDTALMITADHGQASIDSEETIYLNNYPQVTNNFKKSENGFPIPPTENPRDVFLHIEDEKVDETITFLKDTFGEIADIVKLDEDTINKLFGKAKAHPEFFARLGNILILPKGKKSIWYEYLPGQKVEYQGHHGGLTEDEMYIPFIAAKLNKLQ